MTQASKHAAPPRTAPARDRRRAAGGVRRTPRRRGGGGRRGVPGGVRAGAGAVRVALSGARGGAAAARAGQREPAADGARDRGRAPGAARRRRGVAGVRVAEGHPHGRQVPAPRLLRRHQLRPRRQPRRARPPRPRCAGARLVRAVATNVIRRRLAYI